MGLFAPNDAAANIQAPLSTTLLVLGAGASQTYTLPAAGGQLVVDVTSATLASIQFAGNDGVYAAAVAAFPLRGPGTYVFNYSSNSYKVRINTGAATGAITANLMVNQIATT